MKRKGKYFRKTVFCGRVIRIAKYVSGRMGTKDQRRGREKPTAEKVRRWQDKRAVQNCFDLLHCNFHPGALWMTFTYPPGAKPSSEKVRDDIAAFRKRLRKFCRKAGRALKYILTVGRGKRGAVNFHMVRAEDGLSGGGEGVAGNGRHGSVPVSAGEYPASGRLGLLAKVGGVYREERTRDLPQRRSRLRAAVRGQHESGEAESENRNHPGVLLEGRPGGPEMVAGGQGADMERKRPVRLPLPEL